MAPAFSIVHASLTYKCPLQNTQNWPADSREVFWAQAIAQTNADQIIAALTEQGHHALTFIDFISYIPLFLDMHDDITHNPTSDERRAPIQSVVAAKHVAKGWRSRKDIMTP